VNLLKKAIGFVLGPVCVVLLVSLLITPQTKSLHEDSSAFQVALDQAVARLEGGGKALLAGTATPVVAAPAECTWDPDSYTCDTYEPAGFFTCEPAQQTCDVSCIPPHTADPIGLTCKGGPPAYTCDFATCETYDMQVMTCDHNNPQCGPVETSDPPPCEPGHQHTSEFAPYGHTCYGHTCDAGFTCDFTADPRAGTCDAADPLCQLPTFQHDVTTCDPMDPLCRMHNPKGYCTAANYPWGTCDGAQTCDPLEPGCTTVDPQEPGCATPIERTTWGKVKSKYKPE
jgi:hypothetical protein